MREEEKFQQLLAKLGQHPAKLQLFYQNPILVLEESHIPLVEKPSDIPGGPKIAGAPLGSDAIRVETNWWGVTFDMNEKLTQDIATGVLPFAPLSGMITGALAVASVLTGPVAAVVGGAFATAFIVKSAQIKITDQGNGVYWPISWLQWVAVLAAVPLGLAGIVAAIMVFIHPLPNPPIEAPSGS